MAHNGILHRYSSRQDGYVSNGLVAFQHDSSSKVDKIILFVTGLDEGLLTLNYPRRISEALEGGWGLAEVMLRSAYKGFGYTSLKTDVEDLALAVTYFRSLGTQKIVLLGHSTGCQDAVAYARAIRQQQVPTVDGIILQGAVSDREAMVHYFPPLDIQEANALAATMQPDEYMPQRFSKYMLGSPTTAYRWLSMTSPNCDSDEDFFSSDLSDEQIDSTFGIIAELNIPLAVILSGEDESTPPFVNKQALLDRWKGAVRRKSPNFDIDSFAVVAGATHNFEKSGEKPLEGLVRVVVGFLKAIR